MEAPPTTIELARESEKADERSSSHLAYQVLHIGYTVLPILVGVDKFSRLLVNWDQYLSGSVQKLLPFSAHTFMLLVGAVEVAAGILVALLPRVGGFVVAAWLGAIILNLFSLPGFYDIAFRDLVLALGALALGLLSRDYGRRSPPGFHLDSTRSPETGT
ncbi:MAG TPA: hypothetical protein VKU80_11150 [Planctomycetota bacterium]|nr:hypothetical protein [Planctomycetota bacterium]